MKPKGVAGGLFAAAIISIGLRAWVRVIKGTAERQRQQQQQDFAKSVMDDLKAWQQSHPAQIATTWVSENDQRGIRSTDNKVSLVLRCQKNALEAWIVPDLSMRGRFWPGAAVTMVEGEGLRPMSLPALVTASGDGASFERPQVLAAVVVENAGHRITVRGLAATLSTPESFDFLLPRDAGPIDGWCTARKKVAMPKGPSQTVN